MGKLILNIGSMFSGKTTELLRQGKRHALSGKEVVYIKPDVDTRYSDTKIVSHTGDFTTALVVPVNALLWELEEVCEAEIILVDELQFFDEGIAEQLNTLATEGKIIYASGLDMTSERDVYDSTMLAMAYADEVHKLKAVCSKCGEDAYISASKIGPIAEIELGASDKYMALCRDCYQTHLEDRYLDMFEDTYPCGCCTCCGCSCEDDYDDWN